MIRFQNIAHKLDITIRAHSGGWCQGKDVNTFRWLVPWNGFQLGIQLNKAIQLNA